MPWLNNEHELLLAKRDATIWGYVKTGQCHLLVALFDICNIAEEKLQMVRCAFMYNKVNDVLDSNKKFWKELWNLGLLPGTSAHYMDL